MEITIRPTFHRVLVRPFMREMSKGGIIIPDTADEKTQPVEGLVLAVGHGRRPDCGKVLPMSVKKGDRILFRKHAGRHVDLDVGCGREPLRFLSEEDIDAVIEGDVVAVPS
jgi:chaperonin GroES